MRCRSALFMVLFLLCSLFCAGAQEQEKSLRELSWSISERLTDLKKNSALVTERLMVLSESLEQSQREAAQWREQSTSLSVSLASINDELTNCYSTITEYEAELRRRARTLWILTAVVAARIVMMVAGFVLYAKGVRLPRWLDILL